MMRPIRCLPLLGAALLAACGTTQPESKQRNAPTPITARQEPGIPVLPAANSGRGAYYQDDGPGENPPPGLLEVPDAEVRREPILPRSNRPYKVFGKTYTPLPPDKPFTQRGAGTWYGKKFHGQRTSSGEIYDMYKMTAAHPTLPIPSYAQVTNLKTGKTVVVRINDRGPFHSKRVIDVSYTAALKLGLLASGSGELEVKLLLPDDIDAIIAARKGGASQQAAEQSVSPAPVANGPQVMPRAAPMLASSDGDGDGEREAKAQAMLVGGAVAPGFYLQLGSYSRADSAAVLRNRVNATDAGFKLDVQQSGKVFRVFAGPYASRQDAIEAGKALPSSLKLKPIVIER